MASDIESALYAFLAADAGVIAQVGDRIFPVRIPEGATLPALVYHKVSDPSLHSKDGDMNLNRPRFQFTAWADKYADAKAAIKAVRTALQGYTGPTLQGVTVPEIICDSEQDLNDPQSLEFGASLDAIVWHS